MDDIVKWVALAFWLMGALIAGYEYYKSKSLVALALSFFLWGRLCWNFTGSK